MNQHSRPTGRDAAPSTLIVIDHRRPELPIAKLVDNVMASSARTDRVVLWSDDAQAAKLTARHRRLELQAHPCTGWGDRLAELDGDHDGPLCLIEDRTVANGSRWLAELASPINDGSAEMSVTATNAAPFPTSPPDAPDARAGTDAVRRAAQACRQAPARREVATLHGPACAFASGVLAALAPAARELADLDTTGRRIVELPQLYLHTAVDVPQLSVCMIMKDEAADLVECLASVQPIADEIVIYDTGSSDGSVALARSLGATVIEGEWRNDFGWARNQALQAARGTWVLSIDVDERLELDPGVTADLRGLLDDDPPIERFIIDLFDLQGSVHAPVRATNAVPMARLFRRAGCHWVGALHEQPDARPGRPKPRSINLPGVRFLHRGYLDEVVRDRGKWERNLAVAVAGVEALPDNDKDCFDLARSLRSVGDNTRAFALFERAADLAQNLVITRGALEFAVLTLTETGRAELAQPYLDRLAALEGGRNPARYLTGWVHISLNRWAEAAGCFEDIGEDYNDHFTGFRVESVPLGLALAYRGLGRRADATAAAVQTLQTNAQAVEAWAVLFDCSDAEGDAATRVAATIPAEHLVALFAKLASFPAESRDRLAEAIWQVRPGDRIVLAVSSQLAESVELDRALVWSSRLRTNGLAALCPLRKTAEDGNRTVADRAAVLARGVHELDATDLAEDLEKLVELLHDNELDALLRDTIERCPGAAGSVIVAGATTAARCIIIVTVLCQAGFVTEALAVISHAAELDPTTIRSLLSARPELAHTLRSAADASGRDDLTPVLASAA